MPWAAAAIGGALGATIRWATIELFPDTVFPWPVLVVNVVGSALLAIVATRKLPAALLGVGLCGGLTTMSAFAVDVVRLTDDGRAGLAVVYGMATLVGGIGAYALVRRTAT